LLFLLCLFSDIYLKALRVYSTFHFIVFYDRRNINSLNATSYLPYLISELKKFCHKNLHYYKSFDNKFRKRIWYLREH
jgi:hypothetical protein